MQRRSLWINASAHPTETIDERYKGVAHKGFSIGRLGRSIPLRFPMHMHRVHLWQGCKATAHRVLQVTHRRVRLAAPNPS